MSLTRYIRAYPAREVLQKQITEACPKNNVPQDPVWIFYYLKKTEIKAERNGN